MALYIINFIPWDLGIGTLTVASFSGSDIMDKQILQSTRAVSDTNNYAVAVYHDSELHITPLQGIVHLRPSFSYLDKSDRLAREEAKEHGEGKQSRNCVADSHMKIVTKSSQAGCHCGNKERNYISFSCLLSGLFAH
jgi:DNA-directed RNA polymerase-3 subunit RPC5